jgi:hypothetical protein
MPIAPLRAASGALVDATYLDKVGNKLLRAKDPEKTLAGKTARKLYDNFRDFTPQEIDGVLNEAGKTLRQCLTDSIALFEHDPKKHPLGAKVYAEFRKVFRASTSPQKTLADIETDEAEEINPQLLKAAIQYQKTHNRSVFNGALQMLNSVTLTDVIGICQYGLEIKPSSSPEQLRFGMDLMRFFARLDVPGKFAETAKLMTPLFDQVLSEAHAKCKGEDAKPSKFLITHKSIVYLVLPKGGVERILASVQWTTVHSELADVVKTRIGMKLFGAGLQSVQSEVVAATIKKAVDDLFGKGETITQDMLLGAKQTIYTELSGHEWLSSLPDKRKIEVEYLNERLLMNVKCLPDQIEMVLAARWKTLAVSASLLSPLFCELSLTSPVALTAVTYSLFTEDVYNANADARALVRAGFDLSLSKDGDSIVSHLLSVEARALAVDPTFAIEVKFFTEMVGENGQTRLQQKVLNALPSTDRAFSVEDVVQKLALIRATDLFSFCTASAQGQIRIAIEAIHAVAEGREPNLSASLGDFHAKVRHSINCFCVYTTKDKVKTFGGDALNQCLKEWREQPSDTINLLSLALPSQFVWMLRFDDVATYDKLMAGARANELAGVASGLSSSSSSACVAEAIGRGKRASTVSPKSSAKCKAKKAKVVCTEVDAALAMFKRKVKSVAKAT